MAGGPGSSLSSTPVLLAPSTQPRGTGSRGLPPGRAGDIQNSLAPRCMGKASPVSPGPPGLQSLRGRVPTCGSASARDPGCVPAFLRDTAEDPATGRRALPRRPTCTRLCGCRPLGRTLLCARVDSTVCADRLQILPLRDLNRARSAPPHCTPGIRSEKPGVCRPVSHGGHLAWASGVTRLVKSPVRGLAGPPAAGSLFMERCSRTCSAEGMRGLVCRCRARKIRFVLGLQALGCLSQGI